MLKVVICHPHEAAHPIEIENDLRSMQELVGGFIETVNFVLGTNHYVLVCNENGKITGLEPNVILRINNHLDVIVGSLFVTKAKGDSFINLNAANIKEVVAFLNDYENRRL
jgi:hypothetical protein